MTAPLTPEQFLSYAKNNLGNWSDEEIQGAIDTEWDLQQRQCRVEDPLQPALLEALKRRTLVNLAKRGVPVIVTVDGDGSSSFVPRLDAEVRRFEANYRRLVFG